VGDAEALGHALARLLADRALYARMLSDDSYYDHAQHAEVSVMPRLRSFYARAARAA
jgi:hypothetical protein